MREVGGETRSGLSLWSCAQSVPFFCAPPGLPITASSTDPVSPEEAAPLSRKGAGRAGQGSAMPPRWVLRLLAAGPRKTRLQPINNQPPSPLRHWHHPCRSRYWWRAGTQVGEFWGASPTTPRMPSWFSRRRGGGVPWLRLGGGFLEICFSDYNPHLHLTALPEVRYEDTGRGWAQRNPWDRDQS